MLCDYIMRYIAQRGTFGSLTGALPELDSDSEKVRLLDFLTLEILRWRSFSPATFYHQVVKELETVAPMVGSAFSSIPLCHQKQEMQKPDSFGGLLVPEIL